MFLKGTMKILTVIMLIIITHIQCQINFHDGDGCSDKLPEFCNCNKRRITCDCKDDVSYLTVSIKNMIDKIMSYELHWHVQITATVHSLFVMSIKHRALH